VFVSVSPRIVQQGSVSRHFQLRGPLVTAQRLAFFDRDAACASGLHAQCALQCRPLFVFPFSWIIDNQEQEGIYQVPLYRNRDAILFKRNLMEKNSVRNITMVGTDITNRIASWIVSVLKDNPKCENLEFICLFDCNRPHGSREQWHEDIDLQLEEDAHINHTRKSVSDFMNKINSRETNYNGRSNKELEFITDMLDAKEKDSDDLYDQICRPDHLYALIKARTDYIQRCMDLGTEYIRVANKRHKLNE
jgi:hypothetical protein